MDLLERTAAPALPGESPSSDTAPTEDRNFQIVRLGVSRCFKTALKELIDELNEGDEPEPSQEVVSSAKELYQRVRSSSEVPKSVELFSDGLGGLSISCQNADRTKKVQFKIAGNLPKKVTVVKVEAKVLRRDVLPIDYLNISQELLWLQS